VTLTIDADDTGSLRAAVNSYLRWADIAARVRREVMS
jgi:tRNA threonylcarbamoyladenosine modification (KEOPS) complex  Pcc1 subunit